MTDTAAKYIRHILDEVTGIRGVLRELDSVAPTVIDNLRIARRDDQIINAVVVLVTTAYVYLREAVLHEDPRYRWRLSDNQDLIRTLRTDWSLRPMRGETVTLVRAGESSGCSRYAILGQTASFLGRVVTAIDDSTTRSGDVVTPVLNSGLPDVLYNHYYVELWGRGLPGADVAEIPPVTGSSTPTYVTTFLDNRVFTSIESVKQLHIAPGAVIPPRSWVTVFRSADCLAMQVPVWM